MLSWVGLKSQTYFVVDRKKRKIKRISVNIPMQVERLTDSECYELVYWLPRRVSRPSTGRYWLAADLEQRAVGI